MPPSEGRASLARRPRLPAFHATPAFHLPRLPRLLFAPFAALRETESGAETDAAECALPFSFRISVARETPRIFAAAF